MRRKHTAIIILYMFLCLLTATGCGSKQIFQDSDARFQLSAYGDDELENDIYYVKNGSKFYEVYEPSGKNGIYWTGRDYSLIPSMYANDGFIAYASEAVDIKKMTLQRYRYIGYSMGIHGAYMDADGSICFSVKNNVVAGSDADEVLFSAKSDNIRITAINGEPVTADMLSDEGVFVNLEEEKTYRITFYAGTYYGEAEIKADVRMYELSETHTISSAENTKNGYLAIYMPPEMNSGYYSINESGIFKYYNYAKGEKNDDETDMNEANYQSEEERLVADSQQYVVSVKTKTYNAGFYIYYDAEQYEEVKCYLTAPDKTMYDFAVSDGVAFVEIAEAMSGRWTINIIPSDLAVTDISVESTAKADDTTKESKEFAFVEEDENIRFFASYTGEGDVWGTVTNEDGESRTLELNKKEKTLSVTYPYLAPGTYTVTIYHYADTDIGEINYETDLTGTEEEILIIVE